MRTSRAQHRQRTAVTLAVATVVATLISTAGPAGTAEARPGQGRHCDPAWHLVDTPTPPGQNFDSVTVEALAPDDVRFPSSIGGVIFTERPWPLRWDGHSVQPADDPFPGSPYVATSVINSSFDSPDHGWILAADNFNHIYHYTMRWRDGHWTRVPLAPAPDPEAAHSLLEGITSLGPDDAWVVGQVGSERFGGGALIQHWDGTAWRVVPNPMGQTRAAVLHAVDSVSPTAAWAVGQQVVEGTVVPRALRWDGTAWREVDLPPIPEGALTAVTATSPTDVWATGYSGPNAGDQSTRPLVLHYDGTEWTIADLPDLDPTNTSAVYAASPSDVWVTVRGSDGFLHWDGTDWTHLAWPGGNDLGRSLNITGIDGTGPSDIWAIASDWTFTGPNPEPDRVVVAHYGCQGRNR